MRNRILMALAGALLTVGLVGLPTAGSTIPETFTVTPTLTVTLANTSINYGSLPPGGTPATFSPLGGTVTSNGRVRVAFSGSAFTGPATLNQDIRYVHVYDVGNALEANPATGLGGANQEKTTSELEALSNIYESTTAVSAAPFALNLYVRVPDTAAPGSYSGSVELTFTNY